MQARLRWGAGAVVTVVVIYIVAAAAGAGGSGGFGPFFDRCCCASIGCGSGDLVSSLPSAGPVTAGIFDSLLRCLPRIECTTCPRQEGDGGQCTCRCKGDIPCCQCANVEACER